MRSKGKSKLMTLIWMFIDLCDRACWPLTQNDQRRFEVLIVQVAKISSVHHFALATFVFSESYPARARLGPHRRDCSADICAFGH